MKPVQKALTTGLWVVFVLAMVTVIGAGLWARGRMRVGENAIDLSDMDSGAEASQRDALPPIAEVPPFSLLDQDNKPLTRDALLGKPWVASFVFTHCAGPCPMMTQKMSTLQSSIPDSRVHLV